MAWYRIGDKTLSEPMLIQLTDAYMRHSGDMCFNCSFAKKSLMNVCIQNVSAEKKPVGVKNLVNIGWCNGL